MSLEMQNLIEEIENNPQNFIGKVFNAECTFKVENGFHTRQMPMKILDIRGPVMEVEPADKSSEDARILRKFWFGSNIKDDFSEHFIIDLVFATPDDFAVYCKFLEWVWVIRYAYCIDRHKHPYFISCFHYNNHIENKLIKGFQNDS